jgi:Phage integrase family
VLPARRTHAQQKSSDRHLLRLLESKLRHQNLHPSRPERLPEESCTDFLFLIKIELIIRTTAQLEWRDIHEGVIRLRSQIAKNKDGRMLMLIGEIGEIIARRRAAQHPRTPLVFYRERNGKLWSVDRFDKAWRTARTKAGIPEARIFHDFRRTSVRNMTRAGVPEKVAMQIAGHKSRAIFDRYNITNEEDIRAGQLKTERHLQAGDNRMTEEQKA